MGGFSPCARSALLKPALAACGAVWGVNVAAAKLVSLTDAKARQRSQVSQLQCAPASTGSSVPAACVNMGQSAGMAALLLISAPLTAAICAAATCFPAMSTAITLPAQPRNGSKAIMMTIKSLKNTERMG